jgi:hypothetical protein
MRLAHEKVQFCDCCPLRGRKEDAAAGPHKDIAGNQDWRNGNYGNRHERVSQSTHSNPGQALLQRLLDLRRRCQRYTSSYVTPMGEEMFYRYQQSLIDEAITTLGSLLQNAGMPVSKAVGEQRQ